MDKQDEWAEFRGLADEEGLGEYADALVRLCVPSLRLVPRKGKSKGRTRLGGLPLAPADFVWPLNSSEEPLLFVGQIDLAEARAARLPGIEALPERGLLAFFLGYEASDGEHTPNAGRLLFFESATSLVPARAPTHPTFIANPEISLTLDPQTEELPDLETPFYALLAQQGSWPDDPTDLSEPFHDFVESYRQTGMRDEEERPVHRLLGYADPLEADVYLNTEANAAKLPLSAWNSREHYQNAARWRLLLQVDSDPAREMVFGDGGVLAFMIREEDLAARRFDRVWVEWQSH